MNYDDFSIETERLVLKVLNESYANRVLEYYKRNEKFLQEWEPLREESFYTTECQKKQLKIELDGIDKGEMIKLWIFKKEDYKFTKVLGCVVFNNIIRSCFLSCFLGYKLDKDEANKGYMTEAIGAAIELAFKGIGLHRIEANIMPHNFASLKVVQKLGFYNEGLAKKYLKINGEWRDHIHMVLLNESME